MRNILIPTLLLLAACDTRPDHAEYQQVCMDYDSSTTTAVGTTIGANGQVSTTITPITTSWCVRYEVQCIAGKDGSTTCE
jgi:hypothetical protein